MYVLDTDGGKAIIVVTPDGETMLVDAGYPRPDDRDTNRVVEAAQSLGIKQFDYILATHYDADHSGNVASVDAKIPGKVFIDHGDALTTIRSPKHFDSYINCIGDRKRLSVRPGDVLPLEGVKVTVLTSAGEVLSKPLPGAGQPNALCAGLTEPQTQDKDDNAYSVGLLYEFGQFRMVDLADLLQHIEFKLMCPNNPIGTVDLFMVSHHGFARSNGEFLVHALRPKAAIMNNGDRKGGEVPVLDILASSPGLEDLWQLHFATRSAEKNTPEQFIANPEMPCEAKMIKVSAQRDGTFTVTNTRNDFSKTYRR
jgi:beta-lactamase superfamily II metal-dependent hydrolase